MRNHYVSEEWWLMNKKQISNINQRLEAAIIQKIIYLYDQKYIVSKIIYGRRKFNE